MASRVWVLGTVACAHAWVACSSRSTSEPGKRERVLDQIPARVAAVVVADGSALSHARMRQVVDVLRPELPSSVGCAIDAALGCDQVAVGLGEDRSLTIAIATPAALKCNALSRVGRDLYVATVGGGGIANGSTTPVLADATFARARRYLATAPIGFAMAWQGGELIGTARPEPLEAWLAIDTTPDAAPALENALRSGLARMGSEPTTSPFAARIAITREGPQVVARLGAADADLAAAVRTVREWAKRSPEPAPLAVGFTCPAPIAPVVACREEASASGLTAMTIVTRSAKATAALVASSKCSPVVTNQTVRGLRLEADIPPLGLVRGDVLVGSAGRLVTSKAVLVENLAREAASGRTSLTVRRGILEREIRIEEDKKD